MKKREKLMVLLLLIVGIFCVLPNAVNAAAKPKLNKSKATVVVGKTITLKVKNTKKTVKWSSSNKKIATVTKKGVVKGKKVGKAKITAKVGTIKLKCTVTVKKAVSQSVSAYDQLANQIKKVNFENNGKYYIVNEIRSDYTVYISYDPSADEICFTTKYGDSTIIQTTIYKNKQTCYNYVISQSNGNAISNENVCALTAITPSLNLQYQYADGLAQYYGNTVPSNMQESLNKIFLIHFKGINSTIPGTFNGCKVSVGMSDIFPNFK